MTILKRISSLFGRKGDKEAAGKGGACGCDTKEATPEGLARAKAWFKPKLLPAISPAMLELPCLVDIYEIPVGEVPAAGNEGECECFIRNYALATHMGYKRTSKHCVLHPGEEAYVVTTDIVVRKEAKELPEGCKLRAFKINVM